VPPFHRLAPTAIGSELCRRGRHHSIPFISAHRAHFG